MLADNGYFSEANVKACAAAGVEPLIALGRDAHHQSLRERFADAPPAPENPKPVEAMAHRLQTSEGKKLYARRKHIPEPVFGIIKSVLGFRQFLLRGLVKVKAEWTLVTSYICACSAGLGGPIRTARSLYLSIMTANLRSPPSPRSASPHTSPAHLAARAPGLKRVSRKNVRPPGGPVPASSTANPIAQ